MARVRVWYLADGGVRVTSFASWLSPDRIEAETERVVVEGIVPAGTPWVEMDATELPSRDQRHKWRHRNGKVVVDPAVPEPPKVKTVEERLADLERRLAL